MSLVTLLSRVGSKKFFPSGCRFPPVTMVAPLEIASLTCFSTCMKRKRRVFGKAGWGTLETMQSLKMFKLQKTITGLLFSLLKIGLKHTLVLHMQIQRPSEGTWYVQWCPLPGLCLLALWSSYLLNGLMRSGVLPGLRPGSFPGICSHCIPRFFPGIVEPMLSPGLHSHFTLIHSSQVVVLKKVH